MNSAPCMRVDMNQTNVDSGAETSMCNLPCAFWTIFTTESQNLLRRYFISVCAVSVKTSICTSLGIFFRRRVFLIFFFLKKKMNQIVVPEGSGVVAHPEINIFDVRGLSGSLKAQLKLKVAFDSASKM